jgi:hypothetical protein
MRQVPNSEKFSDGGRGIEVPILQEFLKEVSGKRIADFGCGGKGEGKPKTFAQYPVDVLKNNEIHVYDCQDIEGVPGFFCHKHDLTDAIDLPDYFDMATCISVIEHTHHDVYRNKVVTNADALCINTMLSSLVTGGELLVTVPSSSYSYNPAEWIHSYSQPELYAFKPDKIRWFMFHKIWFELEPGDSLIDKHVGDIIQVAALYFKRRAV